MNQDNYSRGNQDRSWRSRREERNNRPYRSGRRQDDRNSGKHSGDDQRRGSWNNSRGFDGDNQSRRYGARGQNRQGYRDNNYQDRQGQSRNNRDGQWGNRQYQDRDQSRYPDRRRDRNQDRYQDRTQGRYQDYSGEHSSSRGSAGYQDQGRSASYQGQRRYGQNKGWGNNREDNRSQYRGNTRGGQDGYARAGSSDRKRFSDRRSRDSRGNRHSYGVHDSRYGAKDWRHEHEPELPAAIKIEDLEPQVRAELKTLEPHNAEVVAKHLVMAGSLLDADPAEAYLHAKAAVSRAGRLAVVREAAALAAYSSGDFAQALREVRAARRISGTNSLRAIEADCQRALGRPDKALETISQTDTQGYDQSELVELVIVSAGAHADLQEYDSGLLEIDQFLDKHEVKDELSLARILSVKVDLLEKTGQSEQAEDLKTQIPVLPDDVTIMDLQEILEADTPKSRSDLRGSSKPLIEACDVLLLDLDGVCYQGSLDIPFAQEGLAEARKHGKKFRFVTNNASRTPQQVAEKLNGHRIEAHPEEVMTAAMDAAGILADRLPPGAKVLAVGGDGVRLAIEQAGFEPVETAEQKPAAVLQGYDASVGWAELAEACYAINQGALFIATNIDATLPTERGFAPGNGALVKCVEHATGKTPFAGGKPFADIYRKAVSSAQAKDPLSIGDRLDTDIAGAKKAGYRSMHVLTGVSDARAVALAHTDQRPSFLALDLRDLCQAHPAPVKQPTGRWTVGDSAGFEVSPQGQVYREEQVLQAETTLSLNDYRALVAAVWEAKDNRVYVDLPKINVVRELSDKLDNSPEASEEHLDLPSDQTEGTEKILPETDLENREENGHAEKEATSNGSTSSVSEPNQPGEVSDNSASN